MIHGQWHVVAAVGAALAVATLIVPTHSAAAAVEPASEPLDEVVILTRHGRSVRGTLNDFPLLVLRGTHAQRGEAHGALAAREIIAMCDATASFLKLGAYAAQRDDVGWEAGVRAVKQFTIPARFEEELAGMLQGIQRALPEPSDRVIKALGREITLDDLRLLETGEIFELMRCSQFSAWGPLTADGQPIVGRNWDYPPLYSIDYACIMAIDPDEPELSPTLDGQWFGSIGSGLATINQDGVYVAGNDAAVRADGLAQIKDPAPAALLLRQVLETAPRDQMVDQFVKQIRDRVAIGLLFHFSGLGDGEGGQAAVVEYDPRPQGFGIQVRRMQRRLPFAVVATNHCVASQHEGRDESLGRYRTIADAINAHGRSRQPISFDDARAIMQSVAKAEPMNTTLYTAVAWPTHRRLMLAVAPAAGQPATQGRYVVVEWDTVFAIE